MSVQCRFNVGDVGPALNRRQTTGVLLLRQQPGMGRPPPNKADSGSCNSLPGCSSPWRLATDSMAARASIAAVMPAAVYCTVNAVTAYLKNMQIPPLDLARQYTGYSTGTTSTHRQTDRPTADATTSVTV